MRNTLFILLALCIFIGCDSEEENGKEIKVNYKEQLNQSLYADEVRVRKGITFTTAGPWTSTIVTEDGNEMLPEDVDKWLLVNPEYGKAAGTYIMDFTLEANYTSEKRNADIRITCGSTTITVSISQDNKTKDGEVLTEESVQSISLNKKNIIFEVGDKKTLEATIRPKKITNETIIWRSDNPSVAEVDENGEVTAIALGTAIISATTENGKKSTPCLVTVDVNILTEEIMPDEWFRRSIDLRLANGTGFYGASQAAALKGKLSFNYELLESLKGIEYFTSLEELDCYGNYLTSLDVSGLVNLHKLICQKNRLETLNVEGATSLKILICQDNNLSTLDLTTNTNLENVNCSNNELTTIKTGQIKRSYQLNCSNNKLTSLQLSNTLSYLNCSDNHLKNLDISNFDKLGELNCTNNNLKELDVSTNKNLYTLRCNDNNLTSLKANNLQKLIKIDCRNNKLISLDVTESPELTFIDCRNNNFSQIDISSNKNLYELSCTENRWLTKIKVWPTFDIASPPDRFTKPEEAEYVYSF